MEKRWIIKPEPEKSIVDELSKAININPYLAKVLVQRGVETFDKAKAFFRPSLEHLHDPFLMLNMDKAVNRLTEAVFSTEKILIYGDYDVDGTTAVSLLYLFLRQFSDQLEFYIPDRYGEGYGISEKGISYAISNGFKLVVALDCGIRAIEQAAQANDHGIDLIICDHHLPGPKLPDAYAILDPKQPQCSYPFKELSGCGVGFKLLQGFCQQNTIEKYKLFEYLDLVAVSIASDIVPIVEENRILAHYGLKKLNKDPIPGLQSLIEVTGRNKDFTVSDVVFSLGPRINAAGRLAHAKESVNLLIGEGHETAKSADLLNERNLERRTFDQSITAEALKLLADQPIEKKSTVLFNESWHKGVIGIVASRCIEHYHRPTIILTESEGKATGSARSVDGFDVHEAIVQCADLLDRFGGHKHAAGLTLPLENVELFIDKFEEVVSSTIHPDQLIPKIEIDVELPLDSIHFKTHNVLNQMEPFGPHNLAPLFGTKNVALSAPHKVMKDKHIKGFLKDVHGTKKYEFIGFGLADKAEKLQVGEPFEIAYHLEENNYMGNRTLILNLKDFRID